MEKYLIVEYKPKYTGQIITVIDTVLKEIGTLPKPGNLIDDPDLRHIEDIYNGRGKFWVALSGNNVVGTVAIRDMGQNTAKLNRMFVLPEHHGTGLGKKLLNTALDHAKEQDFEKIVLNTHITMKRAHRFYEKNGFAKVGRTADKFNFEKDLRNEPVGLATRVITDLNIKQQQAVKDLQTLAFPNVADEEAEEDFCHPTSAQILAYIGDEFVGWAGIHETEQLFEGRSVKLGGYGICTHPDWQRRGIANKVSQAAMDFLRDRGCEVGFLSVELSNNASIKLHKRNGFVLLHRDFSWTNSKGKTKKDTGGMIAPINSQEQFDRILNGKEVLYVGKGYW
jgi:GNAT superfamily N-acetyltransferase